MEIKYVTYWQSYGRGIGAGLQGLGIGAGLQGLGIGAGLQLVIIFYLRG